MAGGDSLLVYDCADVQFLGHRHIFQVFNQSNGLANTHALGCETGQDVRLGLVCEGAESLSVADSLFE